MKNVFNKEAVSYKSDQPETPYTQAKKEWDDRFGEVNVQAANWRFVAVLSMIVSIILLIFLIISFSLGSDRVFVAEVAETGRVMNILPLQKTYSPTVAQKEYFITNFIKLARELSLDPVVAKKNWLSAYNFLTQESSEKLNSYFRKNDPLQLLGKETKTIKITDINPISKTSYQVDWMETTVNVSNQQEELQKFSGVFTIMIKQPTSQELILKNPLGIYIVDFNFSKRE